MFLIENRDTIYMLLLVSLWYKMVYLRGRNAQSRNFCPKNKTKISMQVKISTFLRNKHISIFQDIVFENKHKS